MLFEKIVNLIKNLRKGINKNENWNEFKTTIENNIQIICKNFNTRWLVSICDTYVDYGNPIEKRNAMLISLLINMEKLGQTNLLLYYKTINPVNIVKLSSGNPIKLWDGMKSFNIKTGDLTNNIFRRMETLLIETPVLMRIAKTLIYRLKNNKTILSNLNYYHKNIFNTESIHYKFFKIKKIRNNIMRIKYNKRKLLL